MNVLTAVAGCFFVVLFLRLTTTDIRQSTESRMYLVILLPTSTRPELLVFLVIPCFAFIVALRRARLSEPSIFAIFAGPRGRNQPATCPETHNTAEIHYQNSVPFAPATCKRTSSSSTAHVFLLGQSPTTFCIRAEQLRTFSSPIGPYDGAKEPSEKVRDLVVCP